MNEGKQQISFLWEIWVVYFFEMLFFLWDQNYVTELLQRGNILLKQI